MLKHAMNAKHLFLSTAIPAALIASPAAATCTFTDGVGILCGYTGADSVTPVDTITVNGLAYNISSVPLGGPPPGPVVTAGTATTTVYSGYIDAGRNSDTLILTGITIQGSGTRYAPGSSGVLEGSIIGGAGSDYIELTNVTTSGHVLGDAGGGVLPIGSAGNDTIIVNSSNIGGTIVMGNGTDGDDDLVIINGNSVIGGGVGHRGVEGGADTIVINNGIIGTNADGDSIFAGIGNDNVGIFGGRILATVAMGGDDDTLVIDPGGAASGGVWAGPPPSGETTALSFQTQLFDGMGGDDRAYIFNSGAGVFADNAEWRSWELVQLNNSRMNIADSSITNLNLTNGSTLIQDDGQLQVVDQLGAPQNSVLNVDATSTVSMLDGQANDSILIGAYRPAGGSVLAVDVDLSTRGYDGTASDFIRTMGGTNTPGAGTLVNVNYLGAQSVSGSRRIVDPNGAGTLNTDPGLNAAVNRSSIYQLVSDPSTTGRIYWLEDTVNGGVYLRWTTNITPETTDGYVGGADGVPLGMAYAGGGDAALAAIGDLAAAGATMDAVPAVGPAAEPAGAMHADSCGRYNGFNVWGDVRGSRGEYNRSDLDTITGTAGLEADIGSYMDLGCGRLLAGVFGYLGSSNIDALDGSTIDLDSGGGGVYLRVSSDQGYYGSLLGHIGAGNADIFNTAFASRASYDSNIYGVAGNVGHRWKINDLTWLDLRGYASWTRAEGDDFLDSAGIPVSGFKSTTTTLGAFIGVERSMNEVTSGIARLGVKWTDVDTGATVAGLGTAFTGSQTVATAEIGLQSKLSDSATVSLRGFGELGSDAKAIGGRISLSVKF